jgi:hypothetical protein
MISWDFIMGTRELMWINKVGFSGIFNGIFQRGSMG